MTATPRLLHALPQVYAAAAVRLLLPLLVLPLVASRVGAEAFGRLSFILVWASLLATLIEGGFLAAATRLAVAADTPRRWRIAQQVFTARCVLCIPTILLSALAVQVAGQGAQHPWADTLAIAALACALGWPATWYLQATQQLNRWAGVEVVVHGVMLVACWAVAWSVEMYVAIQLAASSALAWLGWRRLRKDYAGADMAPLWARSEIGPGLRLGWTMMPVAIAGAAYSFALPAAASLQMARTEMGLYFMADRIVRAMLNAADPVSSVVYPRLVARVKTSERAAFGYAAAWAVAGLVIGTLMLVGGGLMWSAIAPLIAQRAAGLDLERLRAVLLVLGGLLPLLFGWRFIGYWILGSGRYDTAYRTSVIVGGIAGVGGAATWGGAAGAMGLAWTALGVEMLVIAVATVGVLLTRHRRTRV